MNTLPTPTQIIAHNAAITPEKLTKALQSKIPTIEVDLTLANGTLVVSHEPKDYLDLKEPERKLQDPLFVLDQIKKAGKIPFLDLKDEITSAEQLSGIRDLVFENDSIMASGYNHGLLLSLREIGYRGKILFSIGDNSALLSFLKRFTAPQKNYGVSIRHTLLNKDLVLKLKEKELVIATWSPNTHKEIANALENRADIITTDNFEIFV